jgi:hypothetical protein
MPNLGNLENMALFVLQQPGANFSAGVPNWASLTNPQYSQQVLDFYINEGYKQLLRDTNDFAPFLVTQTFPSAANAYQYALPYVNPAIATSATAAISAGAQTVTPTSMTNIVLGCQVLVDTANPTLTETVTVTALSSCGRQRARRRRRVGPAGHAERCSHSARLLRAAGAEL